MTLRILLAASVVVAAPALAQAGFQPVVSRPSIRSGMIGEASGIAVSTRDPSRLWIVNDSGSPAEIHLVGTDGADCGHVTLAGARNADWEDLASFRLDGKSWLLVADTGDNDAKRPDRTLFLLEEPAPPETGDNPGRAVPVTREIRFRYDGGPRDCEAVAVDAAQRKILLISKRTDPPEVHELPLDPPEKPGILTTRRIGTVRAAAPTASLIPFRDQPTGLDISADNSLAAVVTYYGVFIFPRKPAESWTDAFARKPASLPPHLLAQAESVAFSKDGNSIFVVSEGKNPLIVGYSRDSRDSRDSRAAAPAR